MGSQTIASLVAKVGVDTKEYQASLATLHLPAQDAAARIGAAGKAAGSSWSRTWSETADATARVGRRMGQDIVNPLAIVGFAASKFGGQITTSFGEAVGITSKLAVQTNGLVMATGQLADAGLLAAASLGKLSGTRMSLSMLSTGVVGLVIGTFLLAQAAGRLASEYSGLDKALRDKALKPMQEFGKELAASEERFQGAVYQLQRLKTQLGLTGDAWVVPTQRTKENAQRVAELTEKAFALKYAMQNELLPTLARYNTRLNEQAGAHERNIASLKGLREAFYSGYGVMLQGDLEKAIKKVSDDTSTMLSDGASGAEIMAKLKDKVAELKTEGANYPNFALPQKFAELDIAINTSAEEVAAWGRRWGEQPAEVTKAAAASKVALDQMADKLKGTISGGLGQGVQEGTNAATQALETWAANTRLQIPFFLRYDGNDAELAAALARMGITPPGTPATGGGNR